MKTITSLASLIGISSAFFIKLASADQHYIGFYLHGDAVFLSLTGQIVTPTQNLSGYPYLWPGLQPSDSSSVLQPVLDGQDMTWVFRNTYVQGQTNESDGNEVSCSLGSTSSYSLQNSMDGKNNWSMTVTNDQGQSATNDYDIGTAMAQAIFDCELYSTDWNFGDVVFKNIKIVADSSDSSWCIDKGLIQVA